METVLMGKKLSKSFWIAVGIVSFILCAVFIMIFLSIESGPPLSVVRDLKASETRVIVREAEPEIVEFQTKGQTKRITLPYPTLNDPHLLISSDERFIFVLINKPQSTAVYRLEQPHNGNWLTGVGQQEVLDSSDLKRFFPDYPQHVIFGVFSSSSDGNSLLIMVRMFGHQSSPDGSRIVFVDTNRNFAKIVSAEDFLE
jgi:hypothetical protein